MHRPQIFHFSLIVTVLVIFGAPDILCQAGISEDVEMTRCWSFPSRETPPLTATADSGHVFLGTAGAKLETLSRSGSKIWSTELGGSISSNLLPVGSSLFVATSTTESNGTKKAESVLRSLSKETGITSWTRNLADAERHFLHSYNGWIITVSANGTIHAFDSNSGGVVWKREIAAGFAARPVFSSDMLLVASTSNQIFTIALSSGEIEGMRKLPFPITAIAAVSQSEVIVGDERGNVSLLLNSGDKPSWRFKSGGQISNFLAVDSNLLAASHDNFVYSIATRNGNVEWKRRLAGRSAYVAALADRYAILSSVEDQGAALIDLRNGKVVGQLILENGETFTGDPIISEGLILAITNRGAYGYSITGCTESKEGGTAK
jgi:outer membrane protein assembly factor BamB